MDGRNSDSDAATARLDTHRPAERGQRLARLRPTSGRLRSIALQWVGILACLVILQLLTIAGVLQAKYFPSVATIVRALVRALGGSEAWDAIAATMRGWAIGLGLALIFGIIAGIIVGKSWVAFRASMPTIEFLRPIPSVALIPVAILLFGAGLETKVFLVVYAAIWPILLQTMYGARDANPVLNDTARSFRLGFYARLRYITVPTLLPYVATGVRISSAIALILAVTTEIVVGAPGVGHVITAAQVGGDLPVMYAYIALSGLLGWVLNAVIEVGQRRVLRWHVSERSKAAR